MKVGRVPLRAQFNGSSDAPFHLPHMLQYSTRLEKLLSKSILIVEETSLEVGYFLLSISIGALLTFFSLL